MKARRVRQASIFIVFIVLACPRVLRAIGETITVDLEPFKNNSDGSSVVWIRPSPTSQEPPTLPEGAQTVQLELVQPGGSVRSNSLVYTITQ